MKNQITYLLILLCLCFTLPGHTEEALAGAGDAVANVPAIATPEFLRFVFNLLPPSIAGDIIAFLTLLGAARLVGKLACTAAHKYCEATARTADDELLARIENSRVLRQIVFWLDLLLSIKPYRGPSAPASAQPPTPAPHPPAPTFPTAVLMFSVISSIFVAGCARLDKGADPLVVRTEQLEQTALATFDLVLHTDDRDRDFFAKHAPAFHEFADWLREPQTIDGTNIWPRATAMIKQVHNIKRAYKRSRSNAELLAAAVANLQFETDKGSRLLTTITNR